MITRPSKVDLEIFVLNRGTCPVYRTFKRYLSVSSPFSSLEGLPGDAPTDVNRLTRTTLLAAKVG